MGLALSERQRNTSRISLGVLVAVGIVGGRAVSARADGAFPSSQSVLLPRDRPREIVLGTTFGLIFTEDDGATWRYSCETNLTRMGRQYVVGPPPDDRIYGLSDVGVPVTADGACSWTVGGGDLTALAPTDVFPDPSNPLRAFVLATDLLDGPTSVYRSMDGGATYSGPIFTAPLDATITGIEVAASAPRTVYMTLYQRPGVHPRLARSDDGGDTWTTTDIETGIGAKVPYLAAVDPAEPRRIYLRINSAAGDPDQFQGLAVTSDAGMTWTVPLRVPAGSLTGFARRPDGNLFAIGTTAPPQPGVAGPPAAFRSDDGGQTFTTQALPFRGAGLSQRDGILFVATNDFLDGFALTSSADGGLTWRTRLRFREITGIKDCVASTCQFDCDYLAGVNLFPPETCNPPPDPGPTDAGPRDASSSDVVEGPTKSGSGCDCGLGAVPDAGNRTALGVALALTGCMVIRRRSRRIRR